MTLSLRPVLRPALSGLCCDPLSPACVVTLSLSGWLLQGEAPGGIPWAEGEHQSEASGLRLPEGLQEVPQQVNSTD